MAVVVTAVSGFDLRCVWKNQAGVAPERSAGGYYINAAQAGEPPGRWWGPGAEALGFREGQVVERGPYELVYRQVDPRTGEKLGRSRGDYVKFADHLARLRAAEPHATAERLLELEREAAQATRQAPVYTDMTVSMSKSISVFHASIRENQRRARQAGDEAGAAWWTGIEQRYQEVLQAANRAGLEYVQQWAGMTRTGYHGTRADGQEPGRFEEALVEEVVCLEAPEWPPLPCCLRRELHGCSVYTRPGTTRYATRVQLAMEKQLLQQAQRQRARRI